MAIEQIKALTVKLVVALKQHDYTGVVLVCHEDQRAFEASLGLVNQADVRPMTIVTGLATASGAKGFTALTVVSIIEEGLLKFDTPLVGVPGGKPPEVDAGVTIHHLSAHVSGVGDYLDDNFRPNRQKGAQANVH